MDGYSVYRDMEARTGGEIYIGVVGPVRTGKSTFIKRFMDVMVLPEMEDVHSREQAEDELPQSGDGTLIMTSEPKFIPKEAAKIKIDDQLSVKIRLIDCVGYMVESATGHMENGVERMVKTPWYKDAIPFSQAATVGTKKVIMDHSTVGLVVTTDGSFGNIAREKYEPAQERAIGELRKIGKPFLVILNSARPYSKETEELRRQIEEKNHVTCIAMNCDQLRKKDVLDILQTLLYEFPVASVAFYLPRWFDLLSLEHPLKAALMEMAKKYMVQCMAMKDLKCYKDIFLGDMLTGCFVEKIDLAHGSVRLRIDLNQKSYYEFLSKLLKSEVSGEYEFFMMLKNLVGQREEVKKIASAMDSVRQTGYGVVVPRRDDMTVEEPKVVKHGGKYGVSMKATAPSVHMISADIVTDIAPIVGSEEQAKDLVDYIMQSASSGKDAYWETLIFGKSIGQMVDEGVEKKIARMTEQSQQKMQETLKKIINESNGGVVFIII